MKYIRTIIVIFLLMGCSAHGSVFGLEDQRIMGCYQDTTINAVAERYALSKIDSIKLSETAQGYRNPPEIFERYSFSLMPDIKLYRLKDYWRIPKLEKSLKYQFFLFNVSDSSIYFFGGDFLKYSRIIKKYLTNNFTLPNLIELIKLYGNTVNENYSFYIINSVMDFYRVYYLQYNPTDQLDTLSMLDFGNSNVVRKNDIKTLKTQSVPDGYIIEMCATEPKGGFSFYKPFVDKWKFKVSKDLIQLLERESLIDTAVANKFWLATNYGSRTFTTGSNFVKMGIMGCFADSLPPASFQSYLIAGVDSIRFKRSAAFPSSDIRIGAAWSFNRYPCLKMYERPRLENDGTFPGSQFLFNSCDSSFYIFGGYVSDFNNTIRDYLNANFNPKTITDLLLLYTNTIMAHQTFHIIDNYDELDTLAKDFIQLHRESIDTSRTMAAVESLTQVITPRQYLKDGEDYKVSFYTWREDGTFWGCDYWEFVVTKSGIFPILRKDIRFNDKIIKIG